MFRGRFFVAGELYWRDRLDLNRPERNRNWSAGLGWLLGPEDEREEGQRRSEIELSARFYGGIHPHGQFRAMPGFGYWAIRLGFNP